MKRFDVVLWGATGFTGALVAEYLATHHRGGPLRWAIAGRSKAKLNRVREALCAVDPAASSLPVLIGDSDDRASLDAIAGDARVVISTVGPYTLYGSNLVAACVDAGTDYCDLTGETQFVRKMIDAHHTRAEASGARIVHCCGFDSIPSDLGTFMVETAMRERHGRPARVVRCLQASNGFAVSGGTVASMLESAREATTDRDVRRVLADPYSLVPGGERSRDQRDQLGVRWDPDFDQWSGPFALATTNSRVVMRSNALLGYAYGRDFRYGEAMSAGKGARGWLQATGMAVGTVAFFTAAAIPPTRWLLEKTVLPAPGDGPSKEARERGRFTTRFVAIADGDGERPGTTRLFGAVHGMQDPGYGETAKMLSEAALCLALDERVPKRGGILTPAACMGGPLIERLRAAGMKLETTESS